MSDYKITPEEEAELKNIHDTFEEANVQHVQPPHNSAVPFNIDEHRLRAKENLNLAKDMWLSMENTFKDSNNDS